MRPHLALFVLLITNVLFSQTFHDTQGKLEISGSGQATFTVPIAMPPSLKNVGPIINLVYSSGQLGGIAGQGCNIGTISNVSRIATRTDIDGYIDGVDFDANDMLALDGQRLILKSGSYWATGSVYQTEVQSNTKIELQGSGTAMYFIVTAPDGSRSWYGNYGGMDATDPTAFYIVRFEDAVGNYMTYHYTKPFNASLCISEIKFSAHINGLAPLNLIRFNYQAAKRKETAYIKGTTHEKAALLKSIEVKTGDQLFREYKLTYIVDPQLGYEKMAGIQEYNGAGEAASPIAFEYENTQTVIEGSEYNTTYFNNLNFSEIKLSGDFDGDGRLDFATEEKLYTNLFLNQSATVTDISFANQGKRFVVQTLNQNKLNQFQSIAYVKEELQSVDFKIYELSVGNFVNTYTKTIAMDNAVNCVSNCPTDPCGNNSTYSPMRGTNQYLEGDFNGDGISEVLIFTFDQNRTYNYESYTIPEPGGPEPEIIIDPIEGGVPGETYWQCVQRFTADQEYSTISIVDLNPNSPSAFNTKGYSAFSTLLLEGFGQNTNTKKYVADFNGDGKAEILFINHYGNYKVIGIKQLNSAPWSQMEVLGNGTLLGYHPDKQLLLGDFNGDGKADFTLPDSRGGEHHTLWHIYYSNPNPSGGEFFVKESHNIVEYWPDTGGRYDTQRHFSSYYALDTNNDGKSDIVRVWRKHYKPDWTINDHDTQWRVSTYANNIGNTTITGEKFTLDYSSAHNHNSDSPEVPTPVVAPFKYRSLSRDLVIVRNHHNQLTFVDFKKDVTKNTLLKKVTASAGNIVDEISYSPMEPASVFSSGLGTLDEFYSSRNSVTYPHVEIKRLPDNFLVSQLKNSIDGVIRYQDFRYHGLVVNMQGLGMIGFNKTARSMWYQTPSAKRTWNVFENDPLLRGGLKRSYSELLQNGSDFSFVPSGNPTGIINSTVNEYVHQTTNNVYIAYLSKQTITDFTTGVINKVSHTYDPVHVLPVATTSKNFLNNVLQGTTTTTNVFENNASGAGSDYYIGRPISSETVVSAYSDVVKRSQSHQYANNRLIKTLKKGNTDEAKYLVEEFEYDNLGNLKKRTIGSQGYPSPFIAPRSTEYTYDPTGRFIRTVKDPEGLISTNNSYHPLYGTVLSSTNPYNETTLTVLDNWGKVKIQTDHFGKKTTHTYLKESNEFVVNITGEDGSHSWLRRDALGRTKRTGLKNIDNSYTIKGFEYDYLGRKYKESEPSSSSTLSQWNTSVFDDYNRTVQIISATGLITNITYSGLTVTASDGTKTTSSTKNANGHVVSATDGGGTINYTYYANGNVKDTNYEGTVISMRYNEWGMKTVLSDPSAGIYRYAYYPTGELRSEATPKGATIYELGPQGKLQSKSIEGDLISQTIEYTYDPTTKMLTRESMLDNGNGYGNTIEYYYENNELAKVTETTPEAQYEKEYKYDGFGRISNESTLAKHLQTGKSSGRQVSNSYKNGYHWQVIDDKEGKVIWQINSVDARGELTAGALGNGVSIAKTYDAFGFPTQFKDDRANGQNIMTLNTAFDPQRGNLTSRYSSLFDRGENFEYDSLDRLTIFTNSRGDQEEQKYDNRGRITSNDLGRYGYDDNKAYQNTSIELTEQSKAYYGNREGLFNDNMEGQAGWTDNYGNNTISYDNNKHLTGKYSLKIANASSSEVMTFSETRIPVDNTQDTEYTYSVWVYTDGAEAEMFLYMGTENTQSSFVAYDNILTTESGLWVKVEQTVLVPAAIKYLSLRLDNNGGGNVWFDDARISRTGDVPTGIRELNISYNALKSPVEIIETDVDKISFRYNIVGNRSLMY